MRDARSFTAITMMAACLAFTFVSTASAQLIGTSVTGDLNFAGSGTTNWFDPTNGMVPAGYGNSSPGGPTVVIEPSPPTFGYFDAIPPTTVSAVFSANQLTLTEDGTGSGSVTL